jgi:hypothetical protein
VSVTDIDATIVPATATTSMANRYAIKPDGSDQKAQARHDRVVVGWLGLEVVSGTIHPSACHRVHGG